MISSFFGLNIAQQGLFAAKTNLDITAHNMANAETDGYSRQYGVQRATSPQRTAVGYVGTGSEVREVKQHRDEYLDYKYWEVMDKYGEYDIKYNALSEIELMFNEPTESGLSAYLDDLFKKLQTLSTNPSDESSRESFISSLKSMTTYLNDIGSQLRDVQDDMNFGVKSSVEQLNSLSDQIATLNVQIRNLELTGNRANDLRDERNRLIDELSSIASVDVKKNVDSKGMERLKISINGQTLVNGGNRNSLEVRPREYLDNPEDNVDLYDIYWESGVKVNLNNSKLSGELVGYLEIRDGNNEENFQADIVSGAGTTTLVLDNINRNDLPDNGEIVVNGKTLKYTGYTYDNTTGQMTMTLDPSTPCPTGATTCSSGNDVEYKGVPHYLNKLNEFARVMAKTINKIHEAGDSNTGLPLLVYKGYSGTPALDTNNSSTYNEINVNNLRVNPDIVNNVKLLKTKYKATDGEGSNDLVKDLVGISNDNSVFDVGEPDNFIQAVISELAIDTNYMERSRSTQEEMEQLIDNRRLSVSDVDIDEETSNLIKFQQAYGLAAKILSVFDEIFDVTINRMGA